MAVRRATGVSRKTIARGLEEWGAGVASVTRLRSPGGARKAPTETDPESARALERLEVLGPDEIAIVHVMNRVVRRCFLLGDDPVIGKNYDHHKESPIHRTFHGKELAETQNAVSPLGMS